LTGALVLLGTLVLASVAGLVLRARNGRVRIAGATGTLPADVRDVVDPEVAVTLVQLSTEFCAPCRQARTVLADLASATAGVHHAEVDLTDRPDLARALSVLRMPTTLAVDAGGRELLRVGGVPNPRALLDALRPHLEPSPT